MNRNQKIALGCGGASCLGVIAVVIVVIVLGVAGYVSIPGVSSYNSNRNSNYNYNSNRNSNLSNTNRNSNSNSSSSSTMSDDDKHKLFQAGGATKDNPLILKVLAKIGFPNGTGDGYPEFVKEHFPWALKHVEFMQTVNTPEKARAYVEAHLND
jgi:hypothetical protein